MTGHWICVATSSLPIGDRIHNCEAVSAQRFLQRIGHVCGFPGEIRFVSTEMATMGCFLEDRTAEFQMVDNPEWIHGENLLDHLLQFCFTHR